MNYEKNEQEKYIQISTSENELGKKKPSQTEDEIEATLVGLHHVQNPQLCVIIIHLMIRWLL